MKPLILLMLCGLMVFSAGVVTAQTATPECGQPGSFCTIATWNYLGQQTLTAWPTNTAQPTLFPTPTLAGQDYPIIAFDPVASPTVLASVTPVPPLATMDLQTGPVYNSLATVEGSLRNAPENISPYYVPNQQGAQLFSYMKWVLGSSIGDELVGPFGPFIGRISAMIGIEIALAGVYFIIFVSRFVLQFVQWIVTLVLKFVPFLG